MHGLSRVADSFACLFPEAEDDMLVWQVWVLAAGPGLPLIPQRFVGGLRGLVLVLPPHVKQPLSIAWRWWVSWECLGKRDVVLFDLMKCSQGCQNFPEKLPCCNSVSLLDSLTCIDLLFNLSFTYV